MKFLCRGFTVLIPINLGVRIPSLPLLWRPSFINREHNPLRPSDCILNRHDRGRNAGVAIVLRQLSRRKDAGGDQQHALAALLHLRMVAYSLFIRYNKTKRVPMARPRKQPANAICHADRPAYAHSLCRECYDSVRWRGTLPTTLAGEARRMAEGVAGKVPRAGRKPESASTYLRTNRPKVAEFVAGVAVKNLLDMEKTVEELKPELSPFEVAVTAHKLESDPKVAAAIQRTLQKRGLDEQSKQHFVSLIWRYAESEDPADEKRQLMALRILGKAFVGEKIEVNKPEPLPIAGAEELMKSIMGDDYESWAASSN